MRYILASEGDDDPCDAHSLLQSRAEPLKRVCAYLQEVQAAVEEAQQCKEPPIEDLWNNVYVDGLGTTMRPIQIGLPRIPV